jgi:hypothetical protein
MATTAARIYTYSSEKITKKLNFEFRNVGETISEVCEIYLRTEQVAK